MQKAWISSFKSDIARGDFFCYFAMLCNWWISTFGFFKKTSFQKCLEHFVYLFQSYKQSLENFGVHLQVNYYNLSLTTLSIRFVLHCFNVSFRAERYPCFCFYCFLEVFCTNCWLFMDRKYFYVHIMTHCYSWVLSGYEWWKPFYLSWPY